MRFQAGKTNGENYSWWLYSSSDLVAWAGETFPTHSNALRAAEAFKAGASVADFDVYEDRAGEWRWRAVRSSDKVAASGEAFASQYNAQRAADNVQSNAAGADGP